MKNLKTKFLTIALTVGLVAGISCQALAAATVDLGTAKNFAVLASSAITNIPTSAIAGDVGLSPAAGTFYTGITSTQVAGTIYAVDGTGPANAVNNPSLLTAAKNDLSAAYIDAAGRTPTTTFAAGDNQLGGQTLTPGVYAFGGAATANITASSPLTLDAQGNPDAVFIFQASSTLITASNSVVRLMNGAQACNIYWQVGSSATLGTNSTFVGTIMASASITLTSGVNVAGRVLAQNGAVTLDSNTIVSPTCATTPPPTGGGTGGTSGGSSSGGSGTTTGSSSGTPTLPNTGYAPVAKVIPWTPLILLGGVVVVGSLYITRKRWAIQARRR